MYNRKNRNSWIKGHAMKEAIAYLNDLIKHLCFLKTIESATGVKDASIEDFDQVSEQVYHEIVNEYGESR